MMYGASVLLYMNATSCDIYWTEIFCRVDVDIIVNFLYTLHILKSVLHQDLRTDMHHGYLVSHISFAYKMLVFIIVEHFLYEASTWGYPQAEAGVDARVARVALCRIRIGLESHKVATSYDVVNRSYHLNVRIEVDAAIFMQNPEASIVAHESILLHGIRLSRIRNDVNIKVILIPLFYLIIRQVLLPRSNALLRQFGQRIASEPAVMYNFWYHIRLFINYSSEKLLLPQRENTIPPMR